jgi:broad specificity phosphatase PhoE
VVYLVRHAHAGKKSQWEGPDLARPLSERGRAEALGLIDQLGDRPLRRLLSSPAVRCLQTVEPLAAQTDLPVEPHPALGVDGSGPDVLELLASPAMRATVLCTHGEVIGKVFDELRRIGIELSDHPHWPKGSTWVLDLDGGRGWRGTFLGPPSVHPVAQDTRQR